MTRRSSALIGLLRVSSTAQLDGLGLETRERLIRAWCRREGHRLVRLTGDNAKSGTLDETTGPGCSTP